jgi:primosomal protein N' (replication factor Y)
LAKTLSYLVPEHLRGRARVGSRVRVPLGRRQAVGYVMGSSDLPADKLKAVLEVLDPLPLFHARHAAFYQRAADYYAFPIGEAVRTALPAGLSGRGSSPTILSEKFYRRSDLEGQPKGAKQQELLRHVEGEGEVSLTGLRELFPAPHAVLQRLVELGYLSVEERERRRDPFAGEEVMAHEPLDLNAAQQKALEHLTTALGRLPEFSPMLLHGVTGSGKTEVYLRAIADCLDRGKQALVMVPEIALTPQLVGRFRSWFQKRTLRLAILHSGLSDGERYDAWRSVAEGDVDVVIGARSAIFAPLPDLGLIVVDEEHDTSYKQSEGFRYNARDLALLRGQMDGAVALLGSATPALNSFFRAHDGQLASLALPERAGVHPLPEVQLVDLGQVRKEARREARKEARKESQEELPQEDENAGMLSPVLQEALKETLAGGEQALLLLNRRGYSPFLLCRDCGATFHCPNCAITLTFSQVERRLRCHYCDFHQRPPESCERCGGMRVMPEGAGTERLEEELSQLFPEARIARMDRDTTTRKGAHARLIARMAAREIDILVGTQMIAKGHDFPQVTLVGVVNADTALNMPDFRSAERVFSLFSQVAGRAGRGQQPGRVLIQTYDPEHYALDFVVRHDYHGFAAMELEQREALQYPPYGHLVNLVLAGNDAEKVAAAAGDLAARLESVTRKVDVLGPAPCVLSLLRGKTRMQILLKSGQRPALRYLVDQFKEGQFKVPAGVALTVDVDPLDMF